MWTPHAAAAGLLGLFTLQAALVAGRSQLLAFAGERVAASMRARAFERLLAQDLAFFDSRRTGELLNRLSADTAAVQKVVATHIVSGARGAIMMMGCALMMLSLSPSLCALAVAVFPPAVLIARAAGGRIKARQAEVQDALAASGAEASRSLLALRTLRLFSAENEAVQRYSATVDAALAQAKLVSRAAALTEAAVSFSTQASLLGVLAVGGQQVLDGALSYGDLSAFLMYTLFLGFNAGNVATTYAELLRAAGASARVLELLQLDALAADTKRKRGALTSCRGGVELRGVCFNYPSRPDTPVLRHLSLSVRAGEKVAIVGESGCGKSTVAALLSGLYAADSGEVLIDGVPLSAIDGEHLRRNCVSVVPQEPALVWGSLRENIALGAPHATESQLVEAARRARCDFAPSLWAADVGELGVQLSGGQRQRVALARVLLRETPIVVLDEFSSALDAVAEEALVEALTHALASRTLILITHRTPALRLVDRVIELRDGMVVRDECVRGSYGVAPASVGKTPVGRKYE